MHKIAQVQSKEHKVASIVSTEWNNAQNSTCAKKRVQSSTLYCLHLMLNSATMFKVLLNSFLHTALSSSSQKELDFMILHILLILHILSKGIGLYDFAHFESQTEKCLHSGPAVCIGCVFEHSLFSKALWTSSQWCCIYVSSPTKSCVREAVIHVLAEFVR